MRNAIISLLVVSLIGSACEDENVLDALNEQDEFALEAMEKEMKLTALYNDSLASYINDTGVTNDIHCRYFDEHFHQHDSLYNMHHINYNRSNGWSDHTMGSGGMMSGQNHNENSTGGLGHCQGNHDFMDSLRHVHLEFHPEL